MAGHIQWSDFWGILKKDTAEVATRWYAALGDDFPMWVVSRGPRVVREILDNAPIGVVLMFIHLLPEKLAREVGYMFPDKYHEAISDAWQKGRKEIE